MRLRHAGVAAIAAAALVPWQARVQASSHREAPFVSKSPKIDATDFYAFNSYEPGRGAFVTLIANYLPLQDAYGGPNFFALDPEALYEIHVDNDGDAKEDVTFQFQFDNKLKGDTGLSLDVGAPGATKKVAVPLVNIGGITAADNSKLNVEETYSVTIVRGDRRTGTAAAVKNAADQSTSFKKPVDNIGEKSISNYAAYAGAHVYGLAIPGCETAGAKVFVGQRNDPFAVNLGKIFDLVNLEAGEVLGAQDQGQDIIADKNVTTIALEIPAACLNDDADTVIGAWTTASVRQARVINPAATFAQPSREGGPWAQVSRLGMPLVNEVVIGVKDKDRFNSSEPSGDGQFLDYVTHPTLPELIEILYFSAGVRAPNVFPRADLVVAFLTGVEGVNKTATPSEMVRLNTGIAATPRASQNSLGAAGCFVNGVLTPGAAGCDTAGFPNGRRPGDDVVDIELRVAMGYLLAPADAPSGQLPIVDGALVTATQFDNAFPYLTTPFPGSP